MRLPGSEVITMKQSMVGNVYDADGEGVDGEVAHPPL